LVPVNLKIIWLNKWKITENCSACFVLLKILAITKRILIEF
jgi:hypothetical protein